MRLFKTCGHMLQQQKINQYIDFLRHRNTLTARCPARGEVIYLFVIYLMKLPVTQTIVSYVERR
jgi:hypothetical protein